MFFFGNFKNNEIADLIGNKDPLGLDTDIEKGIYISNITTNQLNNIKTKEIPSKDKVIMLEESNMVHDAIPHYLKAGNCNNSANTNKEDEGTPYLTGKL